VLGLAQVKRLKEISSSWFVKLGQEDVGVGIKLVGSKGMAPLGRYRHLLSQSAFALLGSHRSLDLLSRSEISCYFVEAVDQVRYFELEAEDGAWSFF